MSWREFAYMINGLSAETPLGHIVSIRAENDPKVYKDFTPEQKRIRNEYRRKIARSKSSKEVGDVAEQLKNAFLKLAGTDEN